MPEEGPAKKKRRTAPGESLAAIPPSPPDKGSFPLDHFRECSDAKSIYMDCLKQHDMQAEDCRHLAAAYLQCRMDACARRPHYLHARSPRSARART